MDFSYHITTDVCVIGAGHAGCEAALACARLGLRTVIFTMNIDSVAMMPCNPHIGGSSKGHLVREIDALGGEMGRNIDQTFIQSKMLNRSKGPAVHSLRAQADKAAYSRRMRQVLESQENLELRQGEVSEILTSRQEDGKTSCIGIRLQAGTVYDCHCVIVCTGTYLNARCLVGDCITETGPSGMQRATFLTESLRSLGIPLRRFKTGTPARMDGRSIDTSKMTIQNGDVPVVPFSFATNPLDVQIEQVPCWLTYTSEETHSIIRDNLDRSPIYSGLIEGTGPRYCPSIEDKVVRFPEKTRHQVFIEPEGLETNEVYVDGMSSSMPDDVQQRMYRTVPGLENCRIVKNAYAIEYDCIDANSLQLSLESREVNGLFFAGQINGSSGYEEAAAQGLIAGINAAMRIFGKEPLILKRSEAYIGVLIDDLVTKENKEPYRMMTSRAEYRLLLRQDNADLRLRKFGWQIGLVDDHLYDVVCRKEQRIHAEVERLHEVHVGASAPVQKVLTEIGSSPLKTAASLADLLSRPEIHYKDLKRLDPQQPALPVDVIEQVEIQIKYQGYIVRQERQVLEFNRLENRRIPSDLDYSAVGGLRVEGRQQLLRHRPSSVGQASRLAGVTPADISVLLIYLEKKERQT